MSFELSIAEFSGPIDVLLSLIEKRKLPINDISLAEVTDEYLSFINSYQGDNTLGNKIHFVYIASTLALIKSKSLLPNLDLTTEEDTDIEKLKQRLMLYQQYQEIGRDIGVHLHLLPQCYEAKDKTKEVQVLPHEGIPADSLQGVLHDLLKEVPEKPTTKQEGYIKIAVHIEEVMDSLVERIKQSQRLDFNQFLNNNQKGYKHPKEQKVYAVVSFLALLEVIRNHGLDVEQDKLFSGITLKE